MDSKPQWIQALRDPLAEDALDPATGEPVEAVPDEIQQLATAARDRAKQVSHP